MAERDVVIKDVFAYTSARVSVCLLFSSASVSQSGRISQIPLAKAALDATPRMQAPKCVLRQLCAAEPPTFTAAFMSMETPKIGFHRNPLKRTPNTENNPSCACEDALLKRHEAMPSLGSDWQRLGADVTWSDALVSKSSLEATASDPVDSGSHWKRPQACWWVFKLGRQTKP